MPQIETTPLAKQDLVDVGQFIAEDSVTAAARFLDAAERAFKKLADMPAMGAPVECRHDRLTAIRMWPIRGFPNHLIFYRPLKDGIEVIRVLHAARDIAAIFEKNP